MYTVPPLSLLFPSTPMDSPVLGACDLMQFYIWLMMVLYAHSIVVKYRHGAPSVIDAFSLRRWLHFDILWRWKKHTTLYQKQTGDERWCERRGCIFISDSA